VVEFSLLAEASGQTCGTFMILLLSVYLSKKR